MKVKVQKIDDVTVVTVAEPVEIDSSNADTFKQAVVDAVGVSPSVILDISLVEFFDSAGMGSLLAIQKRVLPENGRILLTGMNRAVAEMFQMVGFDVVFAVYPDVPAAIDSLRNQ